MIARTPLSLAQVPRVSSTTDKSQKPAKVIPAHLRRAAVSVRGAELVRVVHNAEAPPLSTATGMVSGRCALKSPLMVGRPRWSFRFGLYATFRARSAFGAFR